MDLIVARIAGRETLATAEHSYEGKRAIDSRDNTNPLSTRENAGGRFCWKAYNENGEDVGERMGEGAGGMYGTTAGIDWATDSQVAGAAEEEPVV